MNFQRIAIIIAGCLIGAVPFINNIVIFSLALAKKNYVPALVSLILFVSLILLIAVTDTEKEYPDYLAILGCICAIIPMIYTPIVFTQLIRSEPQVGYPHQKTHPSFSKTDQNLQDLFKEKNSPDLKIYINEDFEDKISQLPLVSLIDAKKIVEARMKDGPFTDIKNFEERIHLSAIILNRIKPSLDFSINQPSSQKNTKNIYSRRVDF